MSFAEGIAGKDILTLGAVVEILRFGEEKENLFADFSISTTIQDGGKRKRSDGFLNLRSYIIFHFPRK